MPARIVPEVENADCFCTRGGIQVGGKFPVGTVFAVESVRLEFADVDDFVPPEGVHEDCRRVDRFAFHLVRAYRILECNLQVDFFVLVEHRLVFLVCVISRECGSVYRD